MGTPADLCPWQGAYFKRKAPSRNRRGGRCADVQRHRWQQTGIREHHPYRPNRIRPLRPARREVLFGRSHSSTDRYRRYQRARRRRTVCCRRANSRIRSRHLWRGSRGVGSSRSAPRWTQSIGRHLAIRLRHQLVADLFASASRWQSSKTRGQSASARCALEQLFDQRRRRLDLHGL